MMTTSERDTSANPETTQQLRNASPLISGWAMAAALATPGRPGWTAAHQLPDEAGAMLNRPDPLQHAIVQREPTIRVIPAMREQDHVAADTNSAGWLDTPDGTELVRHSEALRTSDGFTVGYSDTRWLSARVDVDYASRLRTCGQANAYLNHNGAQLLWTGVWSPEDTARAIGRIWRRLSPRGPLILVHDVLTAIPTTWQRHLAEVVPTSSPHATGRAGTL